MKTNPPKPIRTSLFSVRCWLLNVVVLTTAGSALASLHYVDVNSTNATPPYTNWATAATNIQNAVDAAVAGDEVVVTNGAYATGGRGNGFLNSRVLVDKPLSLRSVNGPRFTTIAGASDGFGFRCVYLTNDATLSGFTLTNGVSLNLGGGVVCESVTAVISNCVISGNYASDFGSAGESYGGGAYGGTLNNCTLARNYVSGDDGYGGGAAACTLNNCTLANNTVMARYHSYGGGAAGCTVNNCTVASNGNGYFPIEAFGGGAYDCTLNNCVITGNAASTDTFPGDNAYGGGADQCTLNSCTVVGNSVTGSGGGGGADGCFLNNCILSSNTWLRSSGAVENDYDFYFLLNHCWVWPSNPLFVDYPGGNNLLFILKQHVGSPSLRGSC